jgi:hypothetical protein
VQWEIVKLHNLAKNNKKWITAGRRAQWVSDQRDSELLDMFGTLRGKDPSRNISEGIKDFKV